MPLNQVSNITLRQLITTFAPKSSDEFKVAKMQELSNFRQIVLECRSFRLFNSMIEQLHLIQICHQKMTLQEAVKIAIQRNPDISQAISTLAGKMLVLMLRRQVIILKFQVVLPQVT